MGLRLKRLALLCLLFWNLASAGGQAAGSSFGSATALVTGVSEVDYISASGEVDYFKFTLQASRHVRLDLSVPSARDYDLYLYNSATSYVDDASSGGTGSAERLERTLSAGTYYVTVRGGCCNQSDPSNPYTLLLTPLGGDTYEPNDTKGTAVRIPMGVETSSFLFTRNDEDWFRFTLGREAHLRIDLQMPDTVTYDIELHTESGYLTQSSASGNGVAEQILTTRPAGEYWVKIIKSYWSPYSQAAPYKLRIGVGPFADAFEPNERKSAAVQVGRTPLFAKVFTDDDADWYRFNTTATGSVTALLDVPASGNFSLELHDQSGYLQGSFNSGNGIDESITRSLPGPATYFIRVEAACCSNTHSIFENYGLALTGPIATASRSNFVVGLGSYGASGGWFNVRGGAESQFNAKSWGRFPWAAYNAGGGGVHSATGDVDGDGRDELVLGVASGGDGWIVILDDAQNGYSLLGWKQVAWPTYNSANGEVWPAVGDVDGDGRAEIVVGLGTGGQGWVEIFDDFTGGFQHLAWLQVGWSSYNAADGSTHPAVADLDGDGVCEIVIGLGTGGGGWIQVYNGIHNGLLHHSWVRVQWPTYNTANGATFPAAGDIDGDGIGEVVVGLGTGGAGFLQVLDDATAGFAFVGWVQTAWAAYNASVGETHPALGNIDWDPAFELVTGLGRYTGNGGWFEVRDDQTTGFTYLGWQSVGWAAFQQAGGSTFPAIHAPR